MRNAAVALLVTANTINARADIGAVAAAILLVVPLGVPLAWLVLPVGVAILGLQIWGSYRLMASVFKWLTVALFAYVGAGVLARPDVLEVLSATILPHVAIDTDFAAALVAILGTTISPYLFCWQASQEVEEEIAAGRRRLAQRKGATKAELEYRAWDVNLGMSVAIVVMYFIMLATGATLHVSGQTEVASAEQAADALRPLAGDAAALLLALGLIGTGVLAIPVLTGSAAYAVSEAFGWKYGLSTKPRNASSSTR